MKPRLRFRTVLLIGGAAVGLPGASPAGPLPRSQALFAVHVADPTTKASTICGSYSPIDPAHPGGQLTCYSFKGHGDLCKPYIVYLLLARGDTSGVAGVSFGIQYNADPGLGVDVTSWVQCADGNAYAIEGPRGEFPASGGGLRQTWITCQKKPVGSDGVDAVIAALDVYAYSSDRLRITPNRPLDSGPELLVASCTAAESEVDSLYHVGWAGFGSRWACPCPPCIVAPGDDSEPPPSPSGPCPVPTNPTTWGRIKSLYR